MAIYSKSQTTVEGLDELIDAFMKLGDESLSYVKEAANEAGNIVLDRAKTKVPVLTGTTKAKLRLKKAKISAKNPYTIFSSIGAAKGSAPLGPLELGHKLVFMGRKTNTQIEARPFLRPAADESKNDVVKSIADAMNKALEQMGGLK